GKGGAISVGGGCSSMISSFGESEGLNTHRIIALMTFQKVSLITFPFEMKRIRPMVTIKKIRFCILMLRLINGFLLFDNVAYLKWSLFVINIVVQINSKPLIVKIFK